MAANEMQVQVLSPSKTVANVKAKGVNLPGTLGYMTILPDHAALISELDVGRLVVEKTERGEVLEYFIAGGYVSVENNKVMVLADTIEPVADIDGARAEKAKQRALDRLTSKDGEIDLERARIALRRAETRSNLAGSGATKKH